MKTGARFVDPVLFALRRQNLTPRGSIMSTIALVRQLQEYLEQAGSASFLRVDKVVVVKLGHPWSALFHVYHGQNVCQFAPSTNLVTFMAIQRREKPRGET